MVRAMRSLIFCLSFLTLPVLAQTSARQGKVVYGTMFRHIDRDGDGMFEEWQREDWRHLDTNRDGKPDLFHRGKLPDITTGWDSDGDGIYDTAQDLISVDPIKYAFEYPIEIQTPSQAIRRDRAVNVKRFPATKPRFGLK